MQRGRRSRRQCRGAMAPARRRIPGVRGMESSGPDDGAAVPRRPGTSRRSAVPLRVVSQRMSRAGADDLTSPLDLSPVRHGDPVDRPEPGDHHGGLATVDGRAPSVPGPGPAPAAAGDQEQHDPLPVVAAVLDLIVARPAPVRLLARRIHRWWAQTRQRRREPAGRHRPANVSAQHWSMFTPPLPQGRAGRPRPRR
jgi:hypothetical protein